MRRARVVLDKLNDEALDDEEAAVGRGRPPHRRLPRRGRCQLGDLINPGHVSPFDQFDHPVSKFPSYLIIFFVITYFVNF